MKQATMNCEDAVESMRAYLEGELSANDKVALLEHVNACPECKADFDARRQVISALSDAYSGITISKSFDDRPIRG
jgi:anti-sigma factor RsiW